jgi:hypothetical protein
MALPRRFAPRNDTHEELLWSFNFFMGLPRFARNDN